VFPERISALSRITSRGFFFYDNQPMFCAKFSRLAPVAISTKEKFYLSVEKNYFAKM
jgi:hypothetical protein